jgi:lipopolysaccharide export system protein LptC
MANTNPARPKKSFQDAERLLDIISRRAKFIFSIKIMLVVVCLSIILFVMYRAVMGDKDGRFNLMFSGVETNVGGESVMLKPHFQGYDEQGQPFNIRASKAAQKSADIVVMDNITADVSLKDSTWLSIVSGSGEVNLKNRTAALRGEVNLYYDNGYELKTDVANLDLNNWTVKGDKQLKGQGPAGLLEANSFEIIDKGNTIKLTNGVRLTIY